MASPTESDWQKVKYLNGAPNLGIRYHRGDARVSVDEPLIGYSDSDFAGHRKTSKSTTGYVIMFNGAAIHWKTQLQRHVTLSSTEAEVIAKCSLAKELAWIRRMAIKLNLMEEQPAVIKCDNQSALRIAQSEKATARTRHLKAQNSFVLEQMDQNELELLYVKAADQLADILTKCVATSKFIINRNRILEEPPSYPNGKPIANEITHK